MLRILSVILGGLFTLGACAADVQPDSSSDKGGGTASHPPLTTAGSWQCEDGTLIDVRGQGDIHVRGAAVDWKRLTDTTGDPIVALTKTSFMLDIRETSSDPYYVSRDAVQAHHEWDHRAEHFETDVAHHIVRLASTGPVQGFLRGVDKVIDGEKVEDGDLVLLKDEGRAARLGVFRVREGNWEHVREVYVRGLRPGDGPVGVYVEEGETHALEAIQLYQEDGRWEPHIYTSPALLYVAPVGSEPKGPMFYDFARLERQGDDIYLTLERERLGTVQGEFRFRKCRHSPR